jgi:PadR family transcriptional regulator PadR
LTSYIGRWYISVMAKMQEPTYYILASLIGGPLHGWAIVQETMDLSGGTVRLTAGTLYGALDRLETEGLVEKDHEEVVSGRCRRYYRLTGLGQDVLTTEAARLAAASRAVQDRFASVQSPKTLEATS